MYVSCIHVYLLFKWEPSRKPQPNQNSCATKKWLSTHQLRNTVMVRPGWQRRNENSLKCCTAATCDSSWDTCVLASGSIIQLKDACNMLLIFHCDSQITAWEGCAWHQIRCWSRCCSRWLKNLKSSIVNYWEAPCCCPLVAPSVASSVAPSAAPSASPNASCT